MAPSLAKLLFSCLIVFCASPVILSRPLNSRELFHELGFDVALDEFHLKNNKGSSAQHIVPNGPDPLTSSKVSGDASLVGFSRNIDVGSSLRVAPSGPDPHHHRVPPTSYKVSGDASLVGFSRNIDVGSSLRAAPGGPDPLHH
ncbi:hypothetical protein AAHA92_11357 [Salvia divinorum]|uniref:Uncharacterized protein n=1 Tax=Salvia divinorum TaxID=28513 RepID=A0ABD1HGR1_SALDI